MGDLMQFWIFIDLLIVNYLKQYITWAIFIFTSKHKIYLLKYFLKMLFDHQT